MWKHDTQTANPKPHATLARIRLEPQISMRSGESSEFAFLDDSDPFGFFRNAPRLHFLSFFQFSQINQLLTQPHRMESTRHAPMGRPIIDTVRHHGATARPSLSPLVACIRMRPAQESHMKLSHVHLKFGTARSGKPQPMTGLHFLEQRISGIPPGTFSSRMECLPNGSQHGISQQ